MHARPPCHGAESLALQRCIGGASLPADGVMKGRHVLDVLIFAAVQLVFATLTAACADGRGRSGVAWFFLGVVFGVIALVAVLVAGHRDPNEPPRRL